MDNQSLITALSNCQGKPALAAARLGIGLAEVEAAIANDPAVAEAARTASQLATEMAEVALQSKILGGKDWAIREGLKQRQPAISPIRFRARCLTPEQSDATIAYIVSVGKSAQLARINKWAAKQDPPFTLNYALLQRLRAKAGVLVEKLMAEAALEAAATGLAVVENRLAENQLDHDRLNEAIDELIDAGDAESLRTAAQLIKTRESLRTTHAKELGQWTEKKEVSGPEGAGLLDGFTEALAKAYGNTKQ